MKKFLKFSLLACLLAVTLSTVSAATTFTPVTSTTSIANNTITIELPSGTYPTGQSELLARKGVYCPAAGYPGNVSDQASLPWSVLGTFALSESEVNTLKTSTVFKTVNMTYDLGCSDIKVMTGTGNAGGSSSGGNSGTTANGIDLSSYSAKNMPIYENSRVVYVQDNGSSVRIKGYMLEQFNNYSKKDSFWREMVFINTDGKSSYRYNLNSSAVYDPYLNSNKTLNPNGSYNYNYAYYDGKINLNSVQEYWTKKTVSLPKGQYFVYIRMSDGSRSNLMSLKSTKDEVSLPSTFSVYPGSTDVVFTRN